MTREEIEARYRQVLEWRAQGVSAAEIAARLGVSHNRIYPLYAKAVRWNTTHTGRLHADAAVTVLCVDRRAIVGLQRSGLMTVRDVAVRDDNALLRIRGIGPDILTQIRADLTARYHEENRDT